MTKPLELYSKAGSYDTSKSLIQFRRRSSFQEKNKKKKSILCGCYAMHLGSTRLGCLSSAVREAITSRHNGCPHLPLNPSILHCTDVLFYSKKMGFRELPTGSPWCKEAPNSRKVVSLIVVEIPRWFGR